MKTLKGYTLLYDATCPMCRLYTGVFVRAGFLDRKGRAPYQELQEGSCPGLDRARAVNEIALLNRQSGEVTYGVESLFRILGHRWRWMRSLFRLRPFAAVARYAYSLVSYNRRVIMPPDAAAQEGAPAFSGPWRAAWILLCWLVTAAILHGWSGRLGGLLPAGSLYRELLICGGQLPWQLLLLTVLGFPRRADYAGNLMTISLAGALLLALAGLGLDAAGINDPRIAAGVFMSVAGLMLLEHLRRCRRLRLPLAVSAGWVLYRVLILYLLMK